MLRTLRPARLLSASLLPACLALLSACIEERAAKGDPADARPAADARLDQGADASAPLDQGADVDGGTCLAAPACPPGYDEVDACADAAICEVVAICGQEILCQICPPGAGFVCGDGFERVDACPPDVACEVYADCAGEYICAPIVVVGCPAYTRAVDGCLPEDPLCWSLADGTACQSDLCPVGSRCGGIEAEVVDGCSADALGCFDRQICGEAITCQVVSHDCDDCEPSCPDGARQVDRCGPSGLPCVRIAECCTEIYCEPCAPEDPSCAPIDGK